ncbi:hypothetical protein [Chroococcidiopsis sp. SAG 2025]|uniref:hypothetical protein n=1 Tax=Chroococcidiopsis sp. SAG 2025 TaxID=171389 RepID=UPI0029372CA2|nr:hypothetical protein [Chroococcidiopsis sp. SAG 2025]
MFLLKLVSGWGWMVAIALVKDASAVGKNVAGGDRSTAKTLETEKEKSCIDNG